MFTEFLWLTALTLNEDEREALKGEINEWVKCFLPKLERESTRTDKCRLVASVERHEFGDDVYHHNLIHWRFFKFVGERSLLFDEKKQMLEEFKATSVQKKKISKSELVRRFYRAI